MGLGDSHLFSPSPSLSPRLPFSLASLQPDFYPPNALFAPLALHTSRACLARHTSLALALPPRASLCSRAFVLSLGSPRAVRARLTAARLGTAEVALLMVALLKALNKDLSKVRSPWYEELLVQVDADFLLSGRAKLCPNCTRTCLACT